MLCTLVDWMDISVLKEKENPFFNRKELSILIKHPKLPTPSKAELIKNLAEKNSVDESQIIVDYIFSKKGSTESFASVKILKEKPEKKSRQMEGEKVETQASQTV